VVNSILEKATFAPYIPMDKSRGIMAHFGKQLTKAAIYFIQEDHNKGVL